ncbi:hypothetical protein [Paenimyroides baculatum]|uniref:Uncharacterized protein n=1 Tax=Paenimyroides baculatum TaxID=2608000 RepID=A0A5M6CRQ8_9FLAO|nr:hypothetical protein [Paenimyroides baculatum]KAA5535785.1 hypothetical protein F0460_04930 [Paenimyroides baculatum]
MSLVDSWAASELDKGVYYSISKMSDHLKQYEKIAWSKDEYSGYRSDYYIILLNNAYLSGKWVASIFYTEKVNKQNKIDGNSRSFIELSVKMFIYGLTDRQDKQIETYEKNENFFQDLYVKGKKNPEKYYWESMDALRILDPAISIYFDRRTS